MDRRCILRLASACLAASLPQACRTDSSTTDTNSADSPEDPGDTDDPDEADADRTAPDAELLDERAFMLEVSSEWPPAAQFEFIGYLQPEGLEEWVHPVPGAASLAVLLAANDALRGVVQTALPESADDVGRGMLMSADGRVFRERPEAISRRINALAAMPPSGSSSGTTVNVEAPSPGARAGGAEGLDGLTTNRHTDDGIAGSDDRDLVTSDGSPWRKVGIQLLRRDDNDIDAVEGWGQAGSGAMIGPRTILTAAHVVVEDGDDDAPKILAAAPAKRGKSWSADKAPANGIAANSKFPWGLRRVTWYFWPEDHEPDDYRYDYAVIVLRNLDWSPGPVWFGYQSTSWLDYKGYNMAGYPGKDLACSDLHAGDSKCGGYLYKNYGNITVVGKYTGTHYIDTQPGMSGGPIYHLNENTDSRTIYFINVAECNTSDCGLAKRLRKGSFGTICDWAAVYPSTYFSNITC